MGGGTREQCGSKPDNWSDLAGDKEGKWAREAGKGG